MVAALAFLATAVATVFAQATAVRWSRTRAAHHGAWTVSLASFALASAALATGASTGWDQGTFRVFYLLGAIVNVPWLALGTLALLTGGRAARIGFPLLLAFSAFAAGVMLSTPVDGAIAPDTIPVGKDHLDALPRILAAAGSGLAALIVFGGAAWSALRWSRARPRLAAGNGLIALGTLVLSSGGLVQGVVGEDESFTLSLALGVVILYAGFVIASSDVRAYAGSSRRRSLPMEERGSSLTSSTRVGSL